MNQLKALMKSLYMWRLGKIKPQSQYGKWVVYIMTFNDNDAGMVAQLYKHYGQRLIVFYSSNATCEAQALAEDGVHIESLTAKNMVLKQAVAYLKAASVIVVDNYVAELAVVPDTVEVYQIWHADGAIKKFGWDDPATSQRPAADQRRFQEVYNKFTHIVVGSEKMGEIFQRAYRLPKERIMLTGFPRSDEYVQARSNAPMDENRILYVPTYRANDADMLSVLRSAFSAFSQMPDKNFTVKLHPTVKLEQLPNLPQNVELSSGDLTELMAGAGTLITDYSSVVFEYALMIPKGCTIFFCPDYEMYNEIPGVQDDFLNWKIGPVANTDAELVAVIQNLTDITSNNSKVNAIWNTKNDGQSVLRLVNTIEAVVK